MTTVTLDQVLELAHQLPRTQRADLIAHLSRDLAAELAVEYARSASAASDAWGRLNQFRADIASLYPQADIGGRLEADRRERDAILAGREESDVHP